MTRILLPLRRPRDPLSGGTWVTRIRTTNLTLYSGPIRTSCEFTTPFTTMNLTPGTLQRFAAQKHVWWCPWAFLFNQALCQDNSDENVWAHHPCRGQTKPFPRRYDGTLQAQWLPDIEDVKVGRKGRARPIIDLHYFSSMRICMCHRDVHGIDAFLSTDYAKALKELFGRVGNADDFIPSTSYPIRPAQETVIDDQFWNPNDQTYDSHQLRQQGPATGSAACCPRQPSQGVGKGESLKGEGKPKGKERGVPR